MNPTREKYQEFDDMDSDDVEPNPFFENRARCSGIIADLLSQSLQN